MTLHLFLIFSFSSYREEKKDNYNWTEELKIRRRMRGRSRKREVAERMALFALDWRISFLDMLLKLFLGKEERPLNWRSEELKYEGEKEDMIGGLICERSAATTSFCLFFWRPSFLEEKDEELKRLKSWQLKYEEDMIGGQDDMEGFGL